MNFLSAAATIITFAAFYAWSGDGIDSGPRPAIRRITPLAPDFSIVTEVSPPEPYEGQQFGIIYWLRAQRPPAAVDIDPQQFASFWTELISLPPGGNPGVRRGQGFSDFLLRQVVAFPLSAGPLQLPPISVKIKRAGGRAGPGGDWDLSGSAQPVDLMIRTLPGTPSDIQDLPMVGNVTGRWTRSAASNNRKAVLELEGDAGLALFNPARALTRSNAASVRLISSEDLPRTVDVAGERRISLLTRQRWEFQFDQGSLRQGRYGDMTIPVFDPRSASWTQLRISGISVAEDAPQSEPATAVTADPAAGLQMDTRPLFPVLLPPLIGLLVAVSGLSMLRYARRRRIAAVGADSRCIPGLAKKLKASPESFLDGAHRAIQQLERDYAQAHVSGAVKSELAALNGTVQSYRFGREPMPPEARLQMLESLNAAARRMRNETMQGAGKHRHRFDRIE